MRFIGALFGAVVLAGVRAEESPAGQDVNLVEPWVGQPGIVVSVADLMARQAARPRGAKLLGAKPRLPRFDRRSVATPFHLAPPTSPSAAALPKAPQTIDPVVNFEAVDVNESGFLPPDSMGAVGLGQILVCVNGRIRTFNKLGNPDAQLDLDTDTFFSSVSNGQGTSDPRVKFDRLSNRWFVTMINTASTNNRILLAVSKGPAITFGSSFTFFFFQHNTVSPSGDANKFADYPTMGVDANALYIGVDVFKGNFYSSGTGFVVRKSSVLGGGPIVVKAFRNIASPSGGLMSPHGVDNADAGATEGYFIGSDIGSFNKLVMRRISDPGGTPTISPQINVDLLALGATTVPPMGGVPNAGGNLLDDLDRRLYSACVRNGRLWTSHNIEVNSAGVASTSGDRDGSRWYEIGNLTTTPSLIQFGTLFDNAVSNPRSYWIPSCTVTGQGHMALGCSMSGPTIAAGAATAGRLAGDALGTIRAPATIVSGGGSYGPLGSDPIERWGDFSFTCVDPEDNMTVWTFQEYTKLQDTWAVRCARLLAPPPATPSNANPSTANTGLASLIVTVTGTSVSGSAFYDPGAGFPKHVTASVDGGVTVNSVTFDSPTQVTLDLNTTAGTVGTRSITITNPDGQSVAAGILTLVNPVGASPTCTVTPPAGPSNASPLTFGFSFSENVSGFSAADIVITNGTAGTFGGSGSSYTLDVTPTADGVVSCKVPANRCLGTVSMAGNAASNTGQVVSDRTAPTVTITGPDPTALDPVNFTVTFSESVSGLSAADFSATSGTVGTVTGGPAVYTVPVSGPSQGTLTLTLSAGGAADLAGNNCPTAQGSVLFDSVAPGCTITVAAATNVSPIVFTITFDEPVTGLTSGEISVTNGTVTAFAGSGASYSLTVTPIAEGAVTVQVPAGAAQDAGNNDNTVSNLGSCVFDITPPDTAIVSGPFDPSASSSATFVFSSTEGGSTFEVQLDGAGFVPNATTSITYNSLAVGTHRFQVRAIDAAGNVDATPVNFAWTISIIISDGAAPLLNPFDSPLYVQTFTVDPPTVKVGWKVDGTPKSMPGGAFVSSPSSLNYNNGSTYDSGATNFGAVMTPVLTMAGVPSNPRLKFMCNYQTDTTGTATDQRIVTVWKGDLSGTWAGPITLSTGASALGPCDVAGNWHEHTLSLAGFTPDLRVEFKFDTIDGNNNVHPGWFVDDLEISDLLVSALGQYPGGGTRAIPVGGTTSSLAIDFKALVSKAAVGSVQLDVEVQPLGTSFTGTPTGSVTGSGAGTILTVPLTLPAKGDYHWQARTVELGSATTSGWMEFGLNPTTVRDFGVGGGGGGGGGGGCGATGLEGIVVLLLLRLRRPRV